MKQILIALACSAPPAGYARWSLRLLEKHVALVEAYMQAQGLFHTAESVEPVFSDTLELVLETVQPSIAGPRRPQDR